MYSYFFAIGARKSISGTLTIGSKPGGPPCSRCCWPSWPAQCCLRHQSLVNPTPISSKTVRFTLPEDNEDESNLKADEDGASEKDTRAATLVGSQFLDDEMSWCATSAWGTNHGSHVLFYSPTVTNPKFPDVEHPSLTKVEAWMLRSPSPPDPAPPPLSRKIRQWDRCRLRLWRNTKTANMGGTLII